MKFKWILAIVMITGMQGMCAEKRCVVVRMQGSIEVPRNGALAEAQLAYVMAHEIGHVLQGVSRHSQEGVMKAHTPNAHALTSKLRFAHEDVSLIHSGLLRLVENVDVNR
jgi:hypothetical protein